MMKDYTKDGYCVVRGAISREMAKFLNDYFHNKKDVATYLRREANRSDDQLDFYGTFGDSQTPKATYCLYGDIASETLMLDLLPVVEENTKLELIPNYTYMRIYAHASDLVPHLDRPACELSLTLNLGGDLWPIYLEGTEVLLTPGDLLIYNGCVQSHWRYKLQGDYCTQVFLHYNRKDTELDEVYRFDSRPMIGYPRRLLK